MADSPAVKQMQRAINARRAEDERLLALLEHGFVLQPEDVAGGLAQLEANSVGLVKRASELTTKAVERAREMAMRDIVEPVLASGSARLPDGWDDQLGHRTAFYAKQAADKIELARVAYVAELGRLLEEAQEMGWDVDTILATLVDDAAARGRAYGEFRKSLRDAVSSIPGQAWTETWQAAWAALEWRPPPESRA